MIELIMHHNALTLIPHDIFAHITKCTFLNLHGAKISRIEDDIFSQLKNLHILHLDHILLTVIHNNMFRGLENLLVLSLDWNPIHKIEPLAFSSLSSLTSLTLFGTRLIIIDCAWFNELPRPISLAISDAKSEGDGPWNCDKLCWLKEEVDDGTMIWFSLDGIAYLPECLDENGSSLMCSSGVFKVQKMEFLEFGVGQMEQEQLIEKESESKKLIQNTDHKLLRLANVHRICVI